MGISNFDVIQANLIIGAGIVTQGNVWHVKPRTGSDGNDGKSPKRALQTLAKALSVATADQNDVVFLYAESNTASLTTDYQSATLDWNKNAVHLIGVNGGQFLGQRSRVAFISTYATASNLFTLSANDCMIQGIEFFGGVNSANPLGGVKVTGDRNHFKNCQISGIGHATMDIADAYSLGLSGSENLIEDCYIGLDTVTLGASANSQIVTLAGGTGARNIIRNCIITTYTNHATNNVFLRVPASTIDRFLLLEDCKFLNPIDSGSTALTQAAVIAAGGSPAGTVMLVGSKTGIFGATDWNSTDSGNVTAINGTVTAATYGLAVDVTR